MDSAIATIIIIAMSVALFIGLVLYIEGIIARTLEQTEIRIIYGELKITSTQDKVFLYIKLENKGSGDAVIYGFRLTLHSKTITKYFYPKVIVKPGETLEQNIDLTEYFSKRLPYPGEEFTITLFLEDGTTINYKGITTVSR